MRITTNILNINKLKVLLLNKLRNTSILANAYNDLINNNSKSDMEEAFFNNFNIQLSKDNTNVIKILLRSYQANLESTLYLFIAKYVILISNILEYSNKIKNNNICITSDYFDIEVPIVSRHELKAILEDLSSINITGGIREFIKHNCISEIFTKSFNNINPDLNKNTLKYHGYTTPDDLSIIGKKTLEMLNYQYSDISRFDETIVDSIFNIVKNSMAVEQNEKDTPLQINTIENFIKLLNSMSLSTSMYYVVYSYDNLSSI